MKYKICSKCKKEKPTTNEFFSKSKSQSDGLYSYCKDCQNERYKKYYADKKEHHQNRRKKYYKQNKEQQINYSKEYQKNHPERTKQIKKRHSIKRSEYIKARVKKWIAANPIHNRLIRQRVRLSGINYDSLTLNELIEIYNLHKTDNDLYICHYCHKALEFSETTIDHIIPISKGGSNSADNITIACLKCNAKKGDRILK